MDDNEFLRRIAELWIKLGGDSEGVSYTWRLLENEIKQQETNQ